MEKTFLFESENGQIFSRKKFVVYENIIIFAL